MKQNILSYKTNESITPVSKYLKQLGNVWICRAIYEHKYGGICGSTAWDFVLPCVADSVKDFNDTMCNYLGQIYGIIPSFSNDERLAKNIKNAFLETLKNGLSRNLTNEEEKEILKEIVDLSNTSKFYIGWIKEYNKKQKVGINR